MINTNGPHNHEPFVEDRKLMKRLSLYLFLLLFSFQASSWADDIQDFQIEGMSVGDSLLDYMSKKEIKSQLKKKSTHYYKNKSYATILVPDKIYNNLETYNDLHIIIKPKDKYFNIIGIEGILNFKNISKCYEKQKNIADDIQKSFESLNLEQYSWKVSKDFLLETEKSVKYIDLILPDNSGSGEFRISCHEEKDKRHLLYVVINSSEFMKFLHNN